MVNVSLPDLLGGVTSQPKSERPGNTLHTSLNALGYARLGLTKRPGTDHVAALGQLFPREGGTHVFRTAQGGSYGVVVSPDRIDAVNLTSGDIIPVVGDLSYVDVRTVGNLVADPETFSSWALSGEAMALAGTGATGPLGWSEGVLLGHSGSASTGDYTTPAVGAGQSTASVYFQLAPGLGMKLGHRVDGVWQDTTVSLTSGEITSDSAGVETSKVYEDGDWYRLVVVFTPGALSEARIRLVLDAVPVDGTDRQMPAWGFLSLSDGAWEASRNTPQYISEEPSSAYRFATAGTTTVVLNRGRTVLKGAGTSPSGVQGRGYCWVRQAGYAMTFKVEVQNGATNVAYESATYDSTGTGGPPDGVEATKVSEPGSERVAEDIQLGMDTTATVGSPGFGQGIVVRREGSVLEYEANSGVIEWLKGTDSFGDTGLVCFTDEVEDLTDLPKICRDGVHVKVTGLASTDADDYWVRFEADEADALGEGKWIEASEPGQVNELDASTLPHYLVLQSDDDVGTATGTPGRDYFQFQEIPWASRLVGDDDTNPFPNFTDRQIRDIAFFRGRMALCTSAYIHFTRANDLFDPWRSTVRSLVDSDRIDEEVAHTSSADLDSMAVLDRRLVVQGDSTQFVVVAEPALTPTTVSVLPIYEDFLEPVRPVVVRDSLFTGISDGFLESFPRDERDGFAHQDVLSHHPQLIPRPFLFMAGSPDIPLVVVANKGNRGTFYCYTWIASQGRRSVQSWWPMQVGGIIIGGGFIGSTLYLTVDRGGSVYLEALDFEDTDGIRLDRKVTGRASTVTLPYAPEGDLVAVLKETGEHYPIQSVVDRDVTLDGVPEGEYEIGEVYRWEATLAPPGVRALNSRGDTSFALGTPQWVSSVTLQLGGHTTVHMVSEVDGTKYPWTHTVPELTLRRVSLKEAASRRVRYALGCGYDNVLVTLTDEATAPLVVHSAEWNIEHADNDRRQVL